MNIIHQLQDENERQAEIIAELRNALADIRDYCRSPKYAEHGSTMNPDDIYYRVMGWNSRIGEVEMNGRAVVDDDGDAIVARYVKEQMRVLLPQIKKSGGFYRDSQSTSDSSSVYCQHASHVHVDCQNGQTIVIDTDLQDAYGIDKQIALASALAEAEKENER